MFNLHISIALCSITLQAMLIWSTGCVRAQSSDGFISLACGATLSSNETYSDDNGIDWMGDAGIMQEGEARLVGQHTYYKVLNGMRVFAGNASKYCYSLTNSVVQSKEFFLIRASFWPGTTQPYVPKSADGIYRVKLLIDADEWTDVELPYFGNDTWWVREMYFRAQRSNIVVCLARSSPDGDAPFISTLELRPLPSTLSTTSYMNATGFDALYLLRRKYYTAGTDYTVTRYMVILFRLCLPCPGKVGVVETKGWLHIKAMPIIPASSSTPADYTLSAREQANHGPTVQAKQQMTTLDGPPCRLDYWLL